MFVVLIAGCVALGLAVAVVLVVVSLPKPRVWPVPEGLGAVPSMRPADRRRKAA